MGSRRPKLELITTDSKMRLPASSLLQRARETRSDMMISQIEALALDMFVERGFDIVTVEEIAAAAQISPRTFYRYFPLKEDVLQVRIHRRAEALKDALAQRPKDEPLLHSLRVASELALSAENLVLLKRWITVAAATPNVLKTILGANILAINRMMAEYFGSRLGVPGDALAPTMLAGAAGGVIQAAQLRWYFRGGNLMKIISEGLGVLEEGVGTNVLPVPAATAGERAARGSSGRLSRRK